MGAKTICGAGSSGTAVASSAPADASVSVQEGVSTYSSTIGVTRSATQPSSASLGAPGSDARRSSTYSSTIGSVTAGLTNPAAGSMADWTVSIGASLVHTMSTTGASVYTHYTNYS